MKINKMILISLIGFVSIWSHAKINVVTTFSDFASITEFLGGDLVEVEYLSHGDQDPHFVPPKPSLALKLKKADLLVSTGMDLEMWLTTLQDKARNKRIMDGALGFVTVSPGIDILEKPEQALSRSEGDVHIFGNPHIHTSPINWITISENILIGLKRVDPKNSQTYEERQKAFTDRVHRAMFGDALVDLIGGEQLIELHKAGTLFEFLKAEYEGRPLEIQLGGWLKQALPFRDVNIVAYHKNWSYFAREFGLNIIGYIEPKPGIPPTPKHVEHMIQLIRDRNIQVMLVASYFEKRKPTTIAQKTGIRALFLPLSVGGQEGVDDNFKLMDFWLQQLNDVISKKE
ncbi:zinc ABC transporter substrate-binding protein [bacterium]|nr:zinc ABC transporter substrate-binding protein [bacterium]